MCRLSQVWCQSCVSQCNLFHRAAALKLVEINSQEKRARIKLMGGATSLGDTSQNGMWDNIRNVCHNGVSMVGQEGFTERVRSVHCPTAFFVVSSPRVVRFPAPAYWRWTTSPPPALRLPRRLWMITTFRT